MILHTTSNQDQLIRKGKGILFIFAGKRHVLSSSVLNGGFRDDLLAVFNFDEKPDDSSYCEMNENTYEEHLYRIAKEKLELAPSLCAGLSTAADMDNMVIETSCVTLSNGFPLTVTAAVTGGIDQNGARPGDPACWEEYDYSYRMLHCKDVASSSEHNELSEKTKVNTSPDNSLFKPGTINIMLHINAALTKGTMVRAVITGSEAKAAACGELLCPSLYSEGIATGSGTDGMIIICDPSTPFVLTAAGKDSQLGEMIGTTIMKALKKAIGLQTDVTPAYQHNVLKRLDRFGVTEERLYAIYSHDSMMDFLNGKPRYTKDQFFVKAASVLNSGYWTGKASMVAHLLDQLAWGMLSMDDVKEMYPMLFGQKCADDLDKESFLQAFCVELVDYIRYGYEFGSNA